MSRTCESVIKENLIEEIIETIEKELDNTPYGSEYHCEDGTIIITDVGYVLGWFREYKDVLRRKYNINNKVGSTI